ncbi:DNA damage inducible transcript 3 L homeolog isoform X1 [Xenopus laevis]|uniref:DNA damage-inducible transcript 3 protein n=2 Tax=Xenopus laevis TaxID=8355 RepID=Q7T2S7_XENLA|nr:DNA damage inducible transcript 3 L homeolog [Xenopus laevis]XP_018100381.1 DNA damage inducible transcript 3 L homeolog isoform X1 [Xenopus laevis]AAI57448.1 Transcription factor GADD153 [Xenopus laevis]AAP48706.1 transcription factor GADD153 [Xenopus laevis]OCT95753.1 hypothetical protein XELAEV_18013440mg [Xenopus laevis]
MMAESLPFCGPTGTLSGWELEAWYEDLQDILWADTKGAGNLLPVVSEQEILQLETVDHSPYIWSTESPLLVDINNEDSDALEAAVQQLPSAILELINSEIQDSCNVSASPKSEDTQQPEVPELDYCSSSSVHTYTEDEEPCASQPTLKRKRSSPSRGGKVRVKEKEEENEKKVSHLLAENERLKGEIERLSKEVEQTRKALIDRMVNLKKD